MDDIPADITLPISKLRPPTLRALADDFGLETKSRAKAELAKAFEAANMASLEQQDEETSTPRRRTRHSGPPPPPPINGTITLLIETIKSETVRLLCKDLDVSAAGKKIEAVQRLLNSEAVTGKPVEKPASTNGTPKRKARQKRKSDAAPDPPRSSKRRKSGVEQADPVQEKQEVDETPDDESKEVHADVTDIVAGEAAEESSSAVQVDPTLEEPPVLGLEEEDSESGNGIASVSELEEMGADAETVVSSGLVVGEPQQPSVEVLEVSATTAADPSFSETSASISVNPELQAPLTTGDLLLPPTPTVDTPPPISLPDDETFLIPSTSVEQSALEEALMDTPLVIQEDLTIDLHYADEVSAVENPSEPSAYPFPIVSGTAHDAILSSL